MGCDIHCYVEKKVNGKWEKITGFVSDHYDPESKYFSSDKYKRADSPIDCRNYSLFSYLAGVRSSGKNVEPLSEPKGLPADVTQEIKFESESWDGDGHSHSWLTVEEMYSGLNRTIHYEGVVELDQYKEFKLNGSPESWSASVGGGKISICTNAEMDKYIEWNWDHLTNYYTVVKWEKKVGDVLEHFVENSLSQLKERCESKDLDDVRIVFWFDN